MQPTSALQLLLACALATAGCTRAATPAAHAKTGTPDSQTTQEPSAGLAGEKGETPDAPLDITWDDLDIPLPPDSTYESWMLSSRAKAVLDRYVRITGYMYGGIAQKDAIRTFPLLRDRDCPFGPGGHAHHAIEVNLRGKLRTTYTGEPVTIEGFLTVAPYTGTNGKTWSVYHLEGTRIQ